MQTFLWGRCIPSKPRSADEVVSDGSAATLGFTGNGERVLYGLKEGTEIPIATSAHIINEGSNTDALPMPTSLNGITEARCHIGRRSPIICTRSHCYRRRQGALPQQYLAKLYPTTANPNCNDVLGLGPRAPIGIAFLLGVRALVVLVSVGLPPSTFP